MIIKIDLIKRSITIIIDYLFKELDQFKRLNAVELLYELLKTICQP